ncbi:MAG: FAD-binding domain-containing protein, partial [Gammaproteobacteria bacterium]|nr:FAD-binding domain-containing protein [Gammaproteobacteria bacterium]
AAGLRARWQPGEASAQRSLRHFVDKSLADYPQRRDRCDLAGTSALSPHLHFGEIGPRQIWHALRSRAAGDSRIGAGAEAFLRQIGWREFSIHLLHHWPDLATRPFQPAYAQFPWRRAPAALRRWQRGHTGYPLVDAGMRELWTTGWMHNRVRMITASFLVKHLLIHWREGEAWFWDTLVDADLANNAASWQWVAGCGADAAPYFRIFNPVLQGQKFDPQGDYVRRWLPELARLPARYLHAPWQADPATLKSAGVGLGKDYPLPIVEHRAARERALAAVRSISGTRGSPRAR